MVTLKMQHTTHIGKNEHKRTTPLCELGVNSLRTLRLKKENHRKYQDEIFCSRF
jgi:hypothetical protein